MFPPRFYAFILAGIITSFLAICKVANIMKVTDHFISFRGMTLLCYHDTEEIGSISFILDSI